MSFATRPNGFNKTLGIQKPIGTMTVRDVQSGANGVCAILFASGGSITYVGNQGSGPTRWYEPATTGIGNGYWLKLTLVSGSLWDGGANNGTLQQLSSTRSFTWTATTGTTKTAQALAEIYSDAGGTTKVTDGTINVYASGTGT